MLKELKGIKNAFRVLCATLRKVQQVHIDFLVWKTFAGHSEKIALFWSAHFRF